VQFYASDMFTLEGDDLRRLPLHMRKATLPGYSLVASTAASCVTWKFAFRRSLDTSIPATIGEIRRPLGPLPISLGLKTRSEDWKASLIARCR
jgi:hypothetical protein